MRVLEVLLEGTNGTLATARREHAAGRIEVEIIARTGLARHSAAPTDEDVWALALTLAESMETNPVRPHKAPAYFTALRYLMA